VRQSKEIKQGDEEERESTKLATKFATKLSQSGLPPTFQFEVIDKPAARGFRLRVYAYGGQARKSTKE
jgi:hypothetical protein